MKKIETVTNIPILNFFLFLLASPLFVLVTSIYSLVEGDYDLLKSSLKIWCEIHGV